MSQPVIADNQPAQVTLEKGKKYAFCACGHSQTQPFCDGSHKGTGFGPKVFEAEQDGEAFLCQCKQTGNAPYCDGTHQQFSQHQVGEEAPSPGGAPGRR
ncbi:MAG: CDGSH iron-sulfur domain-containing protein [Halomonas sp.]|nr:CDGSH iron-sulfur domain-containing protein [Halomonas sp.]MDR9439758.1 CDGSH iron-sulfur domain-containing protein [Halomonas sp.]